MGPIPEDLIVFLLFGAFVLLQILRNLRRTKARRAKVEPVATGAVETQPQPQPHSQPQPQAETMTEAPAQAPWTPTLVEGPRPKPTVRQLQLQLPSQEHPRARRFARRTLLRDRRSLQEAIVVATILGPCRAQRPRDME